MEEILKIDSVAHYNSLRGCPTKHPLITVIDLADAQVITAHSINFGLYVISLKELHLGQLRYGRSHYDHQNGSLFFLAPGQVVGVHPGAERSLPQGRVLIFHPDLIKGTSLGRHMQEYSFFSYDANEALHLSDKEKGIVLGCFDKIEDEIDQSIDKHSKTLITSNIELLLNYCTRFYDRQFFTRDDANKGILEKFEQLLQSYFASDKPQLEGLPSVAYCAEALHLSPNYFGDVIKRETGRSAQEYIQLKVIDMAKERVFDKYKSVSEIAYELGFKYPQHFTRLFKQKTGFTPNNYRTMN
ncbi:helix-turn-helix transcriptional regulator [Mucilaginibacter sp. CSA2-8R]|uniref:helix-turn-helix domain-containing protein n=1 Tax=Mucilaginibacter sp. CSA2-8R TaxID=3141542 RepID=UPI00315DF5B7